MRKLAYALLSATILSLSWPTYGFSLFIFFGFVPLLLLEGEIREHGEKTKRKVALYSYLTFVIFNITTSWWIWNSTKAGAVFAILANSLFMTLVFLSFHIVCKKIEKRQSLIYLVCAWICFEKLHLSWDLSWPWLTLGNVFSQDTKWVQWYQYTGVFGGSLWVWCVNILVFKAVQEYQKTRKKETLKLLFAKLSLSICVPIAISFYIYQNYRQEGEKIEVVVLQPNIDPYQEKYNIDNFTVGELLTFLAKEKVSQNTEFVLSPETVFADFISKDQVEYNEGINLYRENLIGKFPYLSLVCGISMYEIIKDKKDIRDQSNYIPQRDLWYNEYNSAFLMNKTKKMEFYNKSKLVVGVENLPYQKVTRPLLGKLMINLGGTVSLKTTQDKRSIFKGQRNGKIAPIICYESIYGEFVTGYVTEGANLLAVITNDSWWGQTQGHKQLFSYARLRAIETRRSIARAANSGISGFIDQRGDIIKTLPYQTRGSLKASVYLCDKETFYVRFGDYIFRICLFVWAILSLRAVVKK